MDDQLTQAEREAMQAAIEGCIDRALVERPCQEAERGESVDPDVTMAACFRAGREYAAALTVVTVDSQAEQRHVERMAPVVEALAQANANCAAEATLASQRRRELEQSLARERELREALTVLVGLIPNVAPGPVEVEIEAWATARAVLTGQGEQAQDTVECDSCNRTFPLTAITFRAHGRATCAECAPVEQPRESDEAACTCLPEPDGVNDCCPRHGEQAVCDCGHRLEVHGGWLGLGKDTPCAECSCIDFCVTPEAAALPVEGEARATVDRCAITLGLGVSYYGKPLDPARVTLTYPADAAPVERPVEGEPAVKNLGVSAPVVSEDTNPRGTNAQADQAELEDDQRGSSVAPGFDRGRGDKEAGRERGTGGESSEQRSLEGSRTSSPIEGEAPWGPAGHGAGALAALLGALERRRALFWTGRVLVELEREFDPAEEGVGSVQMVLDDEDFAALKTLGVLVEREHGRRDATVERIAEALWSKATEQQIESTGTDFNVACMHYKDAEEWRKVWVRGQANAVLDVLDNATPVEREHEVTPAEREAAWQKRGLPDDPEDSPWRVSAALRDEFDAGWDAALAAARGISTDQRKCEGRFSQDQGPPCQLPQGHSGRCDWDRPRERR